MANAAPSETLTWALKMDVCAPEALSKATYGDRRQEPVLTDINLRNIRSSLPQMLTTLKEGVEPSSVGHLWSKWLKARRLNEQKLK
ncbi:hypothetical protein CA13_06450 [Planctomycetes bacterium CA13]|uniref:Uncharacterized protein n=1 Tax=Novipirellula herctigrandis TaxID=2527986 RepID=A0A5C5YXF8_9BACT|nr:hypothetical protein CA13_06450 [Planctomycetes bacterium CA13]